MRDLGNVLYIPNVRCFIFFSWGYALIIGITPRLRVPRLRYCTLFAFLWTFYKSDIFSSVFDISSIKSLFVRSLYGTSTKLSFFLGFILVSERRCSRFSFWFDENILKHFDPSPLSFYLLQNNSTTKISPELRLDSNWVTSATNIEQRFERVGWISRRCSDLFIGQKSWTAPTHKICCTKVFSWAHVLHDFPLQSSCSWV